MRLRHDSAAGIYRRRSSKYVVLAGVDVFEYGAVMGRATVTQAELRAAYQRSGLRRNGISFQQATKYEVTRRALLASARAARIYEQRETCNDNRINRARHIQGET